MQLFRDSANGFTVKLVNADNEAQDVSAYDIRFEFYQNRTTVTLSMDDGIEFASGGSYAGDGSDGVIVVTVSKDRVNQLCTGTARLRCFNDAGSDPILFAEGTATIEGNSFDA